VNAEIEVELRTPKGAVLTSLHPDCPYFWTVNYSEGPRKFAAGFAKEPLEGILAAANHALTRWHVDTLSENGVDWANSNSIDGGTDMAATAEKPDIRIHDGDESTPDTEQPDAGAEDQGTPTIHVDLDSEKSSEEQIAEQVGTFEGPTVQRPRQSNYAIANIADNIAPRSAALSAFAEIQYALEVAADEDYSYAQLDEAYAHVIRAKDDLTACAQMLKKARDHAVATNDFPQLELSFSPAQLR
jgi:hypothetical protein